MFLLLILLILPPPGIGKLTETQVEYLSESHLLPYENYLGLYAENRTLKLNILGIQIFKDILEDKQFLTKYINYGVLNSVGKNELKDLMFETDNMLGLIQNMQASQSTYSCNIMNLYTAIIEADEVLNSDSSQDSNVQGGSAGNTVSNNNDPQISPGQNKRKREVSKGREKRRAVKKVRSYVVEPLNKFIAKMEREKDYPYKDWRFDDRLALNFEAQSLLDHCLRHELVHLLNRLQANVDTTGNRVALKNVFIRYMKQRLKVDIFPNSNLVNDEPDPPSRKKIKTDTTIPDTVVQREEEQMGQLFPPGFDILTPDTSSPTSDISRNDNAFPIPDFSVSLPLNPTPNTTMKINPNLLPIEFNPTSDITPPRAGIPGNSDIDSIPSPMDSIQEGTDEGKLIITYNQGKISVIEADSNKVIYVLPTSLTEEIINKQVRDITKLQSQVQNLNSYNQKLSTEYPIEITKLNDLLNRLGKLEEEKLLSKLNTLSGKVEDLNNYDLPTSLGNLKAQVDTLEGKETITKIQVLDIIENNDKIKGNTASISHLENQISKISDLNNDNFQQDQKINSLESDTVDMKVKITTLESDKKTWEGNFVRINNDLLENKSKISKITSTISGLEGKILELERKSSPTTGIVVKPSQTTVFDGMVAGLRQDFESFTNNNRPYLDYLIDLKNGKFNNELEKDRYRLTELENKLESEDRLMEGKYDLLKNRIINLEEKSQKIDKLNLPIELKRLNKKTISNEELTNSKHTLIENKMVIIDGRLDVIETIDASQRLDNIEAIDVAQRLGDIEAVDIAKRLANIEGIEVSRRLGNIEAIDVARRLNDIEKIDVSRRLNSMEALEKTNGLDKIDKVDILNRLEKVEKQDNSQIISDLNNRVGELEMKNTNEKSKIIDYESLPEKVKSNILEFKQHIKESEGKGMLLTKLKEDLKILVGKDQKPIEFLDLSSVSLKNNPNVIEINSLIDTLDKKVESGKLERERIGDKVDKVINEQSIIIKRQKRKIRDISGGSSNYLPETRFELKFKGGKYVDVQQINSRAHSIVRKLQNINVDELKRKRAIEILTKASREITSILTSIIGIKRRTSIIDATYLRECMVEISNEAPKKIVYHNEQIHVFYETFSKGYKYSSVHFGRTPQWKLKAPSFISPEFPPSFFCNDFIESEGQSFCLGKKQGKIPCNRDNKKVCAYEIDFFHSGKTSLALGLELSCISGSCEIRELAGGQKISNFVVSKDDLDTHYTFAQAGATAIGNLWNFIRKNSIGLLILYAGAATHLLFLIHFIYVKWFLGPQGKLRWLPCSRKACGDIRDCITCRETRQEEDIPERIALRPRDRTRQN